MMFGKHQTRGLFNFTEAEMERRTAALKPNPLYRMVARGKAAEVFIYGNIGFSWDGEGVTAKRFIDDLKALGKVDTLNVHINSEGGDVFDGLAIYNHLRKQRREGGAKIAVHIDAVAASAASVIAMAGDEILMPEGSYMMIHNVWSFAVGDAKAMRAKADLLDTVTGGLRAIYADRSGQPEATIRKMMDATTWFTAKEAVEKGMADRVVEPLKLAASLRDPTLFANVPAELQRPRRARALQLIQGMRAALTAATA